MDTKKTFYALVLTLLLVSFLSPRGIVQANSLPAMMVLTAPQNKINSSVQERVNSLQTGEYLTVIVTLRQQADLTRIVGNNRSTRQQGTIRALQAVANASQNSVKGFLNSQQARGNVSNYVSLWVFNGFSVTANAAAVNGLAQHPDVFSITDDSLPIVPALASAEANISLVNAPALWNLGDTGQGVVVANMDSGVDVNHPELSARWRSGTNSWLDPYGQHPTTPTDLSGHGTQTMGIMVAGDADGTTIGMAPGARWIAVKIFNDSNSSTATAIHQGFQWLLDPDGNPATDDAPNVVNNSWSFANPGCNLDFEPDLQSLRAAGILPVFAAGNGGPSASTSFSPANNPSAFAVGATNNSDAISSLSSRGPTTCGGSTGPFPELVAPGVAIKTTDRFGLYTNGYSGTSYSAPHVAGGLALLLSVYPDLSAVDQQKALTLSAVDLGVSGPDDIYGYGRLDVLAAYNWLAVNPTSTPAPTLTFTPSPTATLTSTVTPTKTPTSQPSTVMHIGDLDKSSTLSGKNWNGTVIIYVHDTNHQPVAGALVSGKWTNGTTGSVSCTTDSSGYCSITKTGMKTSVSSFTFSVTNVTKSGMSYAASSNHDPDGDSSGTTIVITKP